MSRKVYLIELEGFWLGGRRNVIQFKWYLVLASIMSMLRNFVLTKFQIYLNLQSCSCPQMRAFSVMPCKQLSELRVTNKRALLVFFLSSAGSYCKGIVKNYGRKAGGIHSSVNVRLHWKSERLNWKLKAKKSISVSLNWAMTREERLASWLVRLSRIALSGFESWPGILRCVPRQSILLS